MLFFQVLNSVSWGIVCPETIPHHPAIQVPTALYVVTVVVLGLGRKRSRKLLTASVAPAFASIRSWLWAATPKTWSTTTWRSKNFLGAIHKQRQRFSGRRMEGGIKI